MSCANPIKRILMIALASIMMVPVCTAQAEDFILPSTIAANYVCWAELLGATGVSEEVDTESLDDDTSILHVDDLGVSYSRHTLEYEHAFLYYQYAGCSAVDMDLRAMALFISFEYGNPSNITDSTFKEAKQIGVTILNQMKQTLNDKNALILGGELVPFYVGKTVIFSLLQVDNELIIFAE